MIGSEPSCGRGIARFDEQAEDLEFDRQMVRRRFECLGRFDGQVAQDDRHMARRLVEIGAKVLGRGLAVVAAHRIERFDGQDRMRHPCDE